jgi:hypothetical protein
MKAYPLGKGTKINLYGITPTFKLNIFEINSDLYIYIHDLEKFSDQYVNTRDMRMLDTFKKKYPKLYSRDRDYVSVKKKNYLSINALKHLLTKSTCWENLPRDLVIKELNDIKLVTIDNNSASNIKEECKPKTYSINHGSYTFNISDDSINTIKDKLKDELKLFNDEQIEYILDLIISNIRFDSNDFLSELRNFKDFYYKIKSMVDSHEELEKAIKERDGII